MNVNEMSKTLSKQIDNLEFNESYCKEGLEQIEKTLLNINVSCRDKDGTCRRFIDVIEDVAKIWKDIGDNEIVKYDVCLKLGGIRKVNWIRNIIEGISNIK